MFTFVVEVNKNILILFNNNVNDHNVENNDDHYGIDDDEEHHPTDLLYDQTKTIVISLSLRKSLKLKNNF